VHIITCSAWTAAALFVGVLVFSRTEKKIAEIL